MARRRYIAWSGATGSLTDTTDLGYITIPTSAGVTATVQQLLPTNDIAIIEWGYQTNVVPSAIVNVDLLTTGTVAATVTAYVAADIVKYDDAAAAATGATLSTTGSGYTSTADGTAWASGSVRLLDQGPGWSQSWCKQFPLDREPGCIASNVLRIRAWSATSIGIRTYIIWEE